MDDGQAKEPDCGPPGNAAGLQTRSLTITVQAMPWQLRPLQMFVK
jgi:hypothetical protein